MESIKESIKYYFPGAILIGIALLIAAVPEILLAILVALIIMAGIGALYIGHMIRKSETAYRGNDYDDGSRFAWRPVFRRWYRGD